MKSPTVKANVQIFPLDHYDDKGRLKVPGLYYWSLVWLVRPLIIFVASLSYRQDTGLILSLFYPIRSEFGIGLLISLIPLCMLFLTWWRHKLFDKPLTGIYLWLKPLVIISLLLDILFQIWMANQLSWAFSWFIAASFLVNAFFIGYWLKSERISAALNDWSVIHTE